MQMNGVRANLQSIHSVDDLRNAVDVRLGFGRAIETG